MGWRDRTPKEKGDSFDAQHAHSSASANRKREAGEYPYDLEAKPAVKPAERRGKGKHRRG